MNIQIIPDEDNIVRYVPPSKISVKNGKRILLNDAFLPLEKIILQGLDPKNMFP